MAATRNETLSELNDFLFGFAKSVARIYADDVLAVLGGLDPTVAAPTSAAQCNFQGTRLWSSVARMYDFGIAGNDDPEFGAGQLDGGFADADLFLNSLPALQGFLVEDGTLLPSHSIRAVQSATARHILEGGERYTDHEAFELGDIAADHLSIKEVALLAEMDERSVRNACNPKVPGALRTVAIGKRTMVTRQAARLWLEGRKGYTPLSKRPLSRPVAGEQIHRITLDLPAALAEKVQASAVALGLSLDTYVARQLSA